MISNKEIRNRAAQALATAKEADFSDLDEEAVFEAFAEVWAGFNAHPDWLANFKQQVNDLSGGQVTLEEGKSSDFPTRVKGPAEYLTLKVGDLKKLVILGPYSTPITILS